MSILSSPLAGSHSVKESSEHVLVRSSADTATRVLVICAPSLTGAAETRGAHTVQKAQAPASAGDPRRSQLLSISIPVPTLSTVPASDLKRTRLP